MVTFQDVADFYLKYKSYPTTAAWEKFGDAHEGWFTEELHDSTADAEDFYGWTVSYPQFEETMDKWVKGQGVIMTRNGQAMIILENTPLLLTNFKQLAELSKKSEWSVGDLLMVGFVEIEQLKSEEPITELPKDFKVVGGKWFDTDDDWNYTPWSKFMTDFGMTNSNKSNLPMFLEFQIKNFNAILNWKSTESLRNLFGL